MSIRRGWTFQQDQVLKKLKQQRKIKKWSSIARIMDFQFHMCGRNGKQCRERYKNHLDDQIVEQKFTQTDERLLEDLNNKIGNKWSVIAKVFKGRTSNFLKNQLYSKLRKSLRKLNKFIKEFKIKSPRQFKLNIVYKIVESNDFKIYEKQRHSPEDLAFYYQLKTKLFRYAQEPLCISTDDLDKKNQLITQSKILIDQLLSFSKLFDQISKKLKKPRKKYFNEDDLILNSLSNNRNDISSVIRNQINSEEASDFQSSSSISRSYHDEENKCRPPIIPEPSRFDSKFHYQNSKSQKQNFSFSKQSLNPTRNPSVNKISVNQLQKTANEHLKIVEEAEMENCSKGYRLLQQSEQCQFMEAQYLEHFKSYSIIDESLFQ